MEPMMTQPNEQSLADIFQILRRRKWSLILPALIIFLIAATVALLLPPVYRSTSTILIEEQEIPAEFVRATVTSYAEERIQMIKQRVLSFSRLSELVNRLNLYAELRNSWTAEQIVTKMRDDIRVEPLSAEVKDPRTGRATSATIAFTLAYEGRNPDTVLQVANTLTSLFLSENQQVRERQTAETTQFLETEMNRVRAELGAFDTKIAAFKETHMHELPELFQANLGGKERTERDIDRLTDQIRTLKDREGFLQTQLSGLSVNFGNQDKMRLEELKIQLVNLKTGFSDEHPDVIKTRREIADMEKQVAEARPGRRDSSKTSSVPGDSDNPAHVALTSQLAATTFEIESINRQIRDLRQRVEQYSRRIEASPNVEKAYNALLLEKSNTQAKYNDLMAKYMESQVAHGLEKERKGERFTIIDPARSAERPVKPNRPAIVLIGFVLAVGGGVGIAAIREYSDDSIRDYRRLSRATPYSILVEIPRIETKGDIARRRWKRAALSMGLVVLIAGVLFAFHNLVMDLDTLWTKISMRLNLFV
jgi:polysaccharide chain length determinant protein (PEP-CTERM system associated)